MKVGKNNFRPPPKVESSIVRIEPLNPPPTISFEEFDGLVRICFSRKNKTLAGNFKTQNVMDMIEANYKTYCAQKDLPCPHPFDAKQHIMDVLTSVDMAEQRAAKMDIDDFLKLLNAFHEAGVHFA